MELRLPHIDEIKNYVPKLEVLSIDSPSCRPYHDQLHRSALESTTSSFEAWTSNSSSHRLGYLTHSIFRFYGKFPPPIARHVIEEYSSPGSLVIDPMCGSGTTGIEALLLERPALLADVNPLAVLLAKVKTTRLPLQSSLSAVDEVVRYAEEMKKPDEVPALLGIRNPDHWFLPKTMESLSRLKSAVETVDVDKNTRDFLRISLASIVRRVSRATTEQGRLFLDKESAISNAVPVFRDYAYEAAQEVSSLPEAGQVEVHECSLLDAAAMRDTLRPSNLAICHPPYFTLYRYSRVNSLELAWLGYDHRAVRESEIREAFKSGEATKLNAYLDDLTLALENLATVIKPNGVLALMIGDKILKGEYLTVTALLLSRLIPSPYEVEKIALRIPKYTEASWAASQRRNGDEVGVSLCDYVVVLRRGNNE